MDPKYRTGMPTSHADTISGKGLGFFFNMSSLELRRFKSRDELVNGKGEALNGHIIRDEKNVYTNPKTYMDRLSQIEKDILTAALAKGGLPMSVVKSRYEAQKSKANRPATRRIVVRRFANSF